MNKSERTIRSVFADAEELCFEHNDEGIVSIKGKVIVEGVTFLLTITRNASGNAVKADEKACPKYKYLYTGTISTLDPTSTNVMRSEVQRRKKEEKGLAYQDKDIYSTKKFRCDSSNPEKIAKKILDTIDSLIDQDKSQLDAAMRKAMTPDQLTLPFASEQYIFDFLRRCYPGATPEQNKKRADQLHRTLSKFPATPLAKLGKRRVNSILSEIHATDDAIKLCYLFVEYLLQMRIYVGINPFTMPNARNDSSRSAFAQQDLGDAVFERLFYLLNKDLSKTHLIIALKASGFSIEDIKELAFGDLEIVSGYKDFVVVHIARDYAAVSKHDFSRPAIPDTALYIRKVYRYLLEQKSAAELATEGIWPEGLENKELNNQIRNLLVRAGFTGTFSISGRPSEETTDIPTRILQTNYQHMVASKAGLANDPDTYHILCGTMYKSSTFTNYESHTAPDAMKRLYRLLQPLSTEKKIEKQSGLRTENGIDFFDAWPKTNHEAAHMTGQLVLKPGQRVTIHCEYGCTGIVRFVRERSMGEAEHTEAELK